MTHDEFIKLLEKRGDAVYIVDKGLVRFGKFSLTLLAMFGLIGAFFFGLDIKKASDEAKQARFDTEKTLQELTETKLKLVAAKDELDKSRDSFSKFIVAAKAEMQKHLEEADQSSKRTLAIEQKVTLIQVRVQQFGDSKGLLPAAASTSGDQGTAAASAPLGA